MIKKLKLIICLFIIFLLCGCSANVNIKVDKNNKVYNNIKISEDVDMLYSASVKEYVDEEINYENIDISSYDNEVFNDGDSFGIILNKESSNICDALTSSYYSNYFENLDCVVKSNYYEVSGKTKITYCSSDAMYCSKVKSVNITIELPEKALYNNANSVDGKKYTWNFNRDTKEGNINLKIKRYNTKKNTNDEDYERNNKVNKLSIVIIISIVLVIVLIGFSLYDKYKKNKLDY